MTRPQQDTAPFSPFRFSVVTAAFNAEQWIETLLDSLVKQSIGFPEHLQVIVVDDGSKDGTAAIVRSWIDRYPGNVTLISQPNQGPAAARNRGLEEARGEWISFIDADDFVSPSYFQIADDFLKSSGFDGSIIACNLLQYYEAGNFVVNGHPLAYKFNESGVVDLSQQPEYIQLSSSSCLIRRTSIHRHGLRFEQKIKPTFEDAHMLAMILLCEHDFRIAFLKEAHYFYRRRGSATGLVEGGWANPAKYRDQLLFGYLDLVRAYRQAFGEVPKFVQNLVLYEMHWYMKRLLANGFGAVLSDAQQNEFFTLAAAIFQHVDMRHILLSELPALEYATRIAMLGAFKGQHFTSLPFMLQEVAHDGASANLTHWTTAPATYRLVDEAGHEIPLLWKKRIEHRCGSRTLCYEQRLWAPLDDATGIHPEVDGHKTGVHCRRGALETLTSSSVREAHYYPLSSLPQELKPGWEAAQAPEGEAFDGCWVIMDRVDKADDSAEHFCRWMLRQHPEQAVYFVLDARSRDWRRLQDEGFPLLPYSSRRHLQALAKARWLVSSHVDQPVIDPLRTRSLYGVPTYKTAFLQHGIIKEDLSQWLNTMDLDLMVASVRPEYESLIGERYKFTEREIVLSGLPRHDALLDKARSTPPSKLILLCPTWREGLLRGTLQGLGTEEAKRLFRDSDFCRAWNALTGDESLGRRLREHGYKMLFLPHPEVDPYLPVFDYSKACSPLSWKDVKSVQDLFVRTAATITDYSSLAMDLGFIGRPVAYYQFPENPSYYASQSRSLSYYDYETHGMGPVLQTAPEVLAWLDALLHSGGGLQEKYAQRAGAFYTLRDGHNCNRVYDAIRARS